MTTYKTFLRSARNFEEFARARKTTVGRGLTLEEARRRCRDYNQRRDGAQVAKGTKMEFEHED